ncbi:MAG TPA: hypothetical protein VG986_23555 [Pseudolabrys sp.]|nr:hypothetical protein [Pseudolabrys sp.]
MAMIGQFGLVIMALPRDCFEEPVVAIAALAVTRPHGGPAKANLPPNSLVCLRKSFGHAFEKMPTQLCTGMLPILRIVPVGGVFLAILILVLALTPPDAARAPIAQRLVDARGALLNRDEHPEWRQLLIRAALRRADEINRLRELPDTPARTAPILPPASQTSSLTPATPEPETQAKPEPEARAKPDDQSEAVPEPKAEDAVATAQPKAPVPPTPPEPMQPVVAEPAEPTAPEPAKAEASGPAATSHDEAAASAPAAPPPAAPVATTEPPAAAPAVVAAIPDTETEAPTARQPSKPAPNEAISSIDAATPLPGANAMGAVSPNEMPVMLPQPRPAAADAPEAATPERHRRRRRVHKAEAEQPKRPMTFFDLLFSYPTSDQTPAVAPQPASQPARQPAAAKTAAMPAGSVVRDFGANAN